MNILQINKSFYTRDGTSRYFSNISNLLKKKVHNVLYFSMHHPNNYPSQFSRYFVSNISYRKGSISSPIKILSRMFYSLEAKDNIKQLLDSHPVDIVHIHSIYHHLSPSILFEIKKRNIPIIETIHDYHLIAPNYILFHKGKICEITKPDKYYKAIFHKCVKNSYLASLAEVLEKHFFNPDKDLIDFFIAPSKFVREKFLEYNFPEDKIIVLPHFIDIKCYKPFYSDKNYILYFGRLSEEKGIKFLSEIIKKLPHINFIIVGEGSEKPILDRMIKSGQKNIQLLGYIDDTKLNQVISNCRFSILPSIWYEGFGLTILESNALGKPVVASSIGGISEVIKDGINGLLFKQNSIDDCLKKILALWNNPNLARDMGKSARKFVEEGFSPEKHYRGLMDIYQKAMSKKKKTVLA